MALCRLLILYGNVIKINWCSCMVVYTIRWRQLTGTCPIWIYLTICNKKCSFCLKKNMKSIMTWKYDNWYFICNVYWIISKVKIQINKLLNENFGVSMMLGEKLLYYTYLQHQQTKLLRGFLIKPPLYNKLLTPPSKQNNDCLN